MSFAPLVPLGGLSGYAFLNRTLDRQTALFNARPALQRDTDYFAQTIGTVQSAGDLVADRRLLRVALKAFGLQEDIDSRAFVRAILEQGTESEDALANRLSDDRYRRFADAFGFADADGPRTRDAGFAAQIVDQFRRRAFEVAVGEEDASLRLALNADRELASLAAEEGSDRVLWFRVLGTPPLRKVFETALGLPPSFAQLDIDRQFAEVSARAQRRLEIASVKDLAASDRREALIRQFLLRDQVSAFGSLSAQSIALTLLQGARAG